MKEQIGDRGLTTVRKFGKSEFESLYGAGFGFDDAYLCYSEHYVWGARNEGVRVLEVFLDLDLVPNSYLIDKNYNHPRLVIHPEFMDRISALFAMFYRPDNEKIFTERSSLADVFEGAKDFDWKTPEVIAIYVHFRIDGEPHVFPLMDNAFDWDQNEAEVEFQDSAECMDYCSKRYSAFLEKYDKAFDERGILRN